MSYLDELKDQVKQVLNEAMDQEDLQSKILTLVQAKVRSALFKISLLPTDLGILEGKFRH